MTVVVTLLMVAWCLGVTGIIYALRDQRTTKRAHERAIEMDWHWDRDRAAQRQRRTAP